MKIGLYFGTFNPIHIGHLIIANHMAEHSDLDQIWMVVTPHNPHKQKSSLLDDYHRLHMVHLATEDYPKNPTFGYRIQITATELYRKHLSAFTRKISKTRIFVNHGRRQFELAP